MRGLSLLLLTGCVIEPAPLARTRDPRAEEPVLFGFPIADPLAISSRVGMDHDPVDHEGLTGDATCLDYLGRTFPHCYDQHDGSDFILDGGFDAMDAGSVEILAAADGVVVDRDDGHYDRCSIQGGVIDCAGNDGLANYVILEHRDGRRTWYWHMMNGSVAVEVGDEVACGDVLGRVGSSGFSSMPHLHFEVHEPDDGPSIDPYAGPYSQEESLWADQGWPDGLPGPGCTAE